MKYFALCVLFVLSLTSCRKQEAQIPYNKIVQDNSRTTTLLAINEQLTQKEDSLLQLYVAQSDKKYIRNELGFWYVIENRGNGSQVKKEENCVFSYRLQVLKFDQSGKSLVQKADAGTKKIVTGKKEIIEGLEECLLLLHRGDNATVIIPWYLAYGLKGNEFVPPYCSVIYTISIEP